MQESLPELAVRRDSDVEFELQDATPKTPQSPLSSQIGIGETTSTVSNEEVNTTDPFSEDILKLEGRGVCGLLERIPLIIKILLIAVVAVIGVIVLGALLIADRAAVEKDNLTSRKYIDVTVTLNDLTANVNNEYGYAMLATLAPYGSTLTPILDGIIALTDANATALNNNVFPYILSLNPAQYVRDDITDVKNAIASLQANRALVKQYNATNAYVVMNTYHNVISAILALADDMNDVLGVNNMYCTAFITSYRLAQSVRRVRSLGLIITHFNSFNLSTAVDYERWIAKYNSLSQSFKSVTTGAILDYYQNTVLANKTVDSVALVETVRAQELTAASINVTFDSFELVTRDWIFNYRDLSDVIRAAMYADAAKTSSSNALYLTLACVLPVIFFVITAVVTYLLSLTITGPWRRLNRIQDIAIKRFVPSSMLAMIRCNSITDVEIGKHALRKITFVRARLKGQAILDSDTGPNIAVQRLKKVYEYIGPVVRKYNGFVDQYSGDGFLAIFKDEKDGFNAAVAIQTAMNTFNMIPSNTETHLLTVAHSARVIACAIGENERMNGAFISDHLAILNDVVDYSLEQTSANFKVVVTKPILKDIKKGPQHRYIGAIPANTTAGRPAMEMYEILDASDGEKALQKETFNEATRLLEVNKFTVAVGKFEQCANDPLAQDRAEHCRKKLAFARRLIENWKISDTLNEPTIVLPAFIEHCSAEKNVENINLYVEMEEYLSAKTQIEREVLAKRIVTRYFFNLNVSESIKNNINQQMTNGELGLDLFKELQSEVIVLMKDAHTRFKERRLLHTLCRL